MKGAFGVAGALAALCVSEATRINPFYGIANFQFPLKLDTRAELAHSPPHYPSPWMNPEAPGWEEAYVKAKAFVSQMTLLEKVNLTTGTG